MCVISFFSFSRQRLRDRGHHPGAEPAERGQLPDPQPRRGRPPRRRPRHAPRRGLRGQLEFSIGMATSFYT